MGILGRQSTAVSPPGAIGGAGRSGGVVGFPGQFVFIDLETTGLEPWKDRVIEIAMVVTDGLGQLVDRWCTLVNPGTGDAGPTKIHLIESSWLAAAPTFEAISGDIAARLSGRVAVAHKTDFDLAFLEAEFSRIGHPIDQLGLPSLCTMTVANTVGLPRALHPACRELGYYYDSHNALDDATACAELYHRLAHMFNPSTFDGVVPVAVPMPRPQLGTSVGRQWAAEAVKPRSILSEFTQYLFPHDDSSDHSIADIDRYKATVVGAIEDGYVDAAEYYSIASLAHSSHLSAFDVANVHHEIILALLDRALEDRRLSKDERAEIERAAAWLGVDLSNWDDLVKGARRRVKARQAEFAASLVGKGVVFTGRGVHPSNIREALAAKHQMQVQRAVGPSTSLLIVGSETIETAAVQKAREGQIPILLEAVFWQRLGEI
jgi:DNA polymerase III subunit epsilon